MKSPYLGKFTKHILSGKDQYGRIYNVDGLKGFVNSEEVATFKTRCEANQWLFRACGSRVARGWNDEA